MVNATTTSSILDDIDVQKAIESSYKNGYADGISIEKVPSDEMIFKIMDLYERGKDYLNLKRSTSLEYHPELYDTKEFIKNFIKEHLFEK